MTIKTIARQLEGEGVFYAEGKHLEAGRSASYGRLLRRLIGEGCVNRRKKRTGHGHVYSLTDVGVERAKRIRDEVQGYIEEWAPLVEYAPASR